MSHFAKFSKKLFNNSSKQPAGQAAEAPALSVIVENGADAAAAPGDADAAAAPGEAAEQRVDPQEAEKRLEKERTGDEADSDTSKPPDEVH